MNLGVIGLSLSLCDSVTPPLRFYFIKIILIEDEYFPDSSLKKYTPDGIPAALNVTWCEPADISSFRSVATSLPKIS